MKLFTKEEIKELSVRIYTQQDGGYVYVFAEDNLGNIKSLLEFRPDGYVYRCLDAKIGDFKFDNEGRIIIN